MEEKVKALWIAASVHCQVFHGDFLDENSARDADGNEIPPEDPLEAIEAVTDYIKGMI